MASTSTNSAFHYSKGTSPLESPAVIVGVAAVVAVVVVVVIIVVVVITANCLIVFVCTVTCCVQV